MPVSDEEILWAYRIVLARDPEDAHAYEAQRNHTDLHSLCGSLFASKEFAEKNPYAASVTVRRKPFGSRDTTEGFIAHATERMLVVSGCQAEPLAKLLQALCGARTQSRFLSFASLEGYSSGRIQLPEEWRGFDVVLTQKPQLLDRVRQSWPDQAAKWHLIPLVTFDGFHPDQCYVHQRNGVAGIVGPMGAYHSLICSASYCADIPVGSVARLFHQDVFEAMGYYERWDNACNALLAESEGTMVPLHDLLPAWNERGCWMRTLNHPVGSVLADVAKAYLRHRGISYEQGAEQYVRDELIEQGEWPAYFGASRPMLPSALRFRPPASLSPDSRGVYFMDLPTFVERSYLALSQFDRSTLYATDLGGEIDLQAAAAKLKKFVQS